MKDRQRELAGIITEQKTVSTTPDEKYIKAQLKLYSDKFDDYLSDLNDSGDSNRVKKEIAHEKTYQYVFDRVYGEKRNEAKALGLYYDDADELASEFAENVLKIVVKRHR